MSFKRTILEIIAAGAAFAFVVDITSDTYLVKRQEATYEVKTGPLMKPQVEVLNSEGNVVSSCTYGASIFEARKPTDKELYRCYVKHDLENICYDKNSSYCDTGLCKNAEFEKMWKEVNK